MMFCWKCGGELKELYLKTTLSKVAFRAACEHCQAPLHCCRNCVHYKPGLPNDCDVPGTEFVSDREAMNYCEEFSILGKKVGPASTPKDVSKRLFGEEPEEKKKNPFDDLFS